jgi:hypothetical protein
MENVGREDAFGGGCEFGQGPPALLLHEGDLVCGDASELWGGAVTAGGEEDIVVADDFAKMLVGATVFFVDRAGEQRADAEFFEKFSLGCGEVGFAGLNFASGCYPEDKRPIAALSGEANEEEIAGLVEEEDASGAAEARFHPNYPVEATVGKFPRGDKQQLSRTW